MSESLKGLNVNSTRIETGRINPERIEQNYEDFNSVEVSGNYRLIFRFHKGNAYDIDYLDYH